jgi:hypothetical protein
MAEQSRSGVTGMHTTPRGPGAQARPGGDRGLEMVNGVNGVSSRRMARADAPTRNLLTSLSHLAMGLALVASSGCLGLKAYVDPQYHRADYATIPRPARPVPLDLSCEFERNGQPFPAAEPELRVSLERTLRASGVFDPGGGAGAPARLHVVANNLADVGAAAAKGFGTGLTLGAVGSRVDDNYEFSFDYTPPRGSAVRATYRHVIHSVVGNADGPPGLAPTTFADAFARVVEDVTLNFLEDSHAGAPAGIVDDATPGTAI